MTTDDSINQILNHDQAAAEEATSQRLHQLLAVGTKLGPGDLTNLREWAIPEIERNRRHAIEERIFLLDMDLRCNGSASGDVAIWHSFDKLVELIRATQHEREIDLLHEQALADYGNPAEEHT